MDRVLVGFDGSDASIDALGWAWDIGSRARLSVSAVRVFEPTQSELPPDLYSELEADQLAQLDAACDQLASGGTAIETMLLEGEPADQLLEAARQRRADLLVVGGRGSGGFADLHLGSVAHHLCHHTDRPLAVVPRTGSEPVDHIVLGCDGSEGSAAAVGLVAELAPALDVGVTAVHAYEPLVEWVPESDSRSWRHQIEERVNEWVAPLEDAGIEVAVDVDRDIHPVAALERAIQAKRSALAVVGTRGLGGFTGLRLGKVPLQLTHHTGAAVILVPAP
jgi:nucleotide-binding universal stress UspA family protein